MACRGDADTAAVCLKSLIDRSVEPLRVVIFNDGTLEPRQKERLLSSSPEVSITEPSEADDACLQKLERFPACRKYRKANPLIRKVIDLPLMAQGDLYYADSDIYFVRRYEGLFEIAASSQDALFMDNAVESYCVAPWHLAGWRPLKLASRINSGIVCLREGCYDLEYVEYLLGRWGGVFARRHIWWADQTCWAALAARLRAFVCAPAQIPVMSPGFCVSPATVAVHFVSTYRSGLSRFVAEHGDGAGDAPTIRIMKLPVQRCTALRVAISRYGRRLGLPAPAQVVRAGEVG